MQRLMANDNYAADMKFEDYFLTRSKSKNTGWLSGTKTEVDNITKIIGRLLERLILTEQLSLREAEIIIGDDALTLFMEDLEEDNIINLGDNIINLDDIEGVEEV